MKRKALLIYSWFVRTVCFFLPDAPILMRFRGFLYSFGMKSCGSNFQVAHSAIMNNLENISAGNDVYIAHYCVLLAGGGIYLEDGVIIGPNVVIASGNRTRSNGSFRFGSSRYEEIAVRRGGWVAANCTLVPGAELPKGSVLGANSLLNKKYDIPNSLYAGVPAILITSEEKREAL